MEASLKTTSANIPTCIEKAAQALKDADYLLILAGAGFSADSGLATYETMPEEYRELCNPLLLIQQPSRFQQFWIDFATKYATCQPHGGYEILDHWCHGGTLGRLTTKTTKDGGSASSSAWWVYTSNVDGHFRRFPSFQTHVCEIHGFAGEFRCACAMGRLEGRNGRQRQGIDWDQWNDQVDPAATEKCDSSVVKIMGEQQQQEETVITCDHCGCLARPNVLLFHDTDENVLKAIKQQRDRYQTWEAQMEDDIVLNGKRLVILEFGCGMNVPAVRIEAEEVLADCLDRIKSKGDEQDYKGGGATLVRVNPKDAGIENEQLQDHVISIFDTSLNVIQSIDQALSELG